MICPTKAKQLVLVVKLLLIDVRECLNHTPARASTSGGLQATLNTPRMKWDRLNQSRDQLGRC
jgi:hypothetical protein